MASQDDITDSQEPELPLAGEGGGEEEETPAERKRGGKKKKKEGEKMKKEKHDERGKSSSKPPPPPHLPPPPSSSSSSSSATAPQSPSRKPPSDEIKPHWEAPQEDPDVTHIREHCGPRYFSRIDFKEDMFLLEQGEKLPEIPSRYKPLWPEPKEKKKDGKERKESKMNHNHKPFLNIRLWSQPSSWKGGVYRTPLLLVKAARLGYGNWVESCDPDTLHKAPTLDESHIDILVYTSREDYVGEFEKYWEEANNFFQWRGGANQNFYLKTAIRGQQMYAIAGRQELIEEHRAIATTKRDATAIGLESVRSHIPADTYEEKKRAYLDEFEAAKNWKPTDAHVGAYMRKKYGRGFDKKGDEKDGDVSVKVEGGSSFAVFEAPVTRGLDKREISALKGRDPPFVNDIEKQHYMRMLDQKEPKHRVFNNIAWHDLAYEDPSQEPHVPWEQRVLDPMALISLHVLMVPKESPPHKSYRMADQIIQIDSYRPGIAMTRPVKVHAPHKRFLGAVPTPGLLTQMGGDASDVKRAHEAYMMMLASAIRGGGGGGGDQRRSLMPPEPSRDVRGGDKWVNGSEGGGGGGGGWGGGNRGARRPRPESGDHDDDYADDDGRPAKRR